MQNLLIVKTSVKCVRSYYPYPKEGMNLQICNSVVTQCVYQPVYAQFKTAKAIPTDGHGASLHWAEPGSSCDPGPGTPAVVTMASSRPCSRRFLEPLACHVLERFRKTNRDAKRNGLCPAVTRPAAPEGDLAVPGDVSQVFHPQHSAIQVRRPAEAQGASDGQRPSSHRCLNTLVPCLFL